METLIVLGALALLVRVGLAMYGTGVTRSKNSAAAIMRAVCDLCVATLAFWAVGGALLTQPTSWPIGLNKFWLFGGSGGGLSFFLLAVVLSGTGAVAGAVAERSRFIVVAATSLLLAGLVIPVAGNWAWYGWLYQRGFMDTAGSSWVHVVAAMAALAGAAAVGARTGKYNRDGSASMIPGHNVPLAAAGTLLVLVGWIGCVVGCSVLRIKERSDASAVVGQAAMNTIVAAAAAGAAGMVFSFYRYGKPDIILILMAVMGGLVAISARPYSLAGPTALLIGAVAGVLVPIAAVAIDLRGHIDDPGGVIAIHGVGGVWGIIITALMAPVGLADRLKLLVIQIIGLCSIAALSLILCGGLFLLLKATVGVRSKEADEYDGLDLAEHDIGAYPDFQQTMIKSYHLREA